jgi:hypothetical protein
MTHIISTNQAASTFARDLVNSLDKGLTLPYQDENSIRDIFTKYCIPYEKWSELEKKRFSDQIRNEETVVHVIDREWTLGGPDPRVVRFSEVVALRVFHPNGKDELFEYKFDKGSQQFKVKTERDEKIPGISEKRFAKEKSPVDSAVRGLQEELKMNISPERIERDKKPKTFLFKPDDRGFYVGLFVHNFVLELSESDSISDSYEEKQKDIHNQFRWEPRL